ncbi:MAG: rhodanese-like domain-containing protein [Betaproteobacteria bacterium]|nr:rhodanese-like domain-containing protein [Betaproteobacteria bacterium]
MPITRGFRRLVDDSLLEVITYSVDQIIERRSRDRPDISLQLVDIRDVRELEREGSIPGALHAPRGMLEFWVDPESPYFKSIFADEDKEFVLFCGGGWRSALAAKTLQDMGMTKIAHMDGGFTAWKAAQAEVISYQHHRSESTKPTAQDAND